MKKDVFGSLVAGTVAGLFMGSVAMAQAAKPTAPAAGTAKTDTVHHCQNACKGKSECGGKDHTCHGKNACKGKGYIKAANEAECKTKGGTWKM